MALGANDEFVTGELSFEELEAVAAGGFWSSLKHIASEVGSVAGKIGFDVAIGLSVLGGIDLAVGGAASQRNPNAMN